VKNLAEVLDETGRGALVLLDELAGGTDPREGEALAAGVLDSLCARGGAVAATTHYEGLKALALADPRFINASVGVDLSTMTPTFELAMGIPGSSSALAVARRYGLPSTVIERAERFLTREDQSFEAVVKKLHDERAALELARAAAEERELEARQAKTRADAELEAAKSRAKKILSEEASELMDRLRRARDDLREARARLRSKKVDAEGVREAERAIERVSGEVAIGGALGKLVAGPGAEDAVRDPVRIPDLRKGLRVWVPRLRAEAEVVEVLGDGTVRVAAGPLKLSVPAGDLRAAAVEKAEAPASLGRPMLRSDVRDLRRPSEGRADSRAGERRADLRGVDADASADRGVPPIQTHDNTCDLRGLRVEDGVGMATSFLDRAVGGEHPVVFLLHGHGTGALRDAIRKELARSPYVAKFRGGDPDQGGDGVTLVWLA
jgi:DNA mismatch repair protein MutS2